MITTGFLNSNFGIYLVEKGKLPSPCVFVPDYMRTLECDILIMVFVYDSMYGDHEVIMKIRNISEKESDLLYLYIDVNYGSSGNFNCCASARYYIAKDMESLLTCVPLNRPWLKGLVANKFRD